MVMPLVHRPVGHLHLLQGDGEDLPVQVPPGGAQDLALGAAHQHGGVREQHRRADVADEILAGEGVALGDGGVGIAGNEACIAVEGGLDLLQLVPVGQGEEPRPQQGHAQGDQPQGHGDLAQVHAFGFFHGHPLCSSNL